MRLLLGLFCIAILNAQTAVPGFEQFPATETFSGKPAVVVLQSPNHRQFRTMIRTQAAKGPNFAGRYTVALWGCGSSCVQGALIDEKTGHVVDLPWLYLAGAGGKYGDGTVGFTEGYEMVSFHKDSRLIAFHGCPEEDAKRCGAYYYEWTGTQFKLISKFGHTPEDKAR